MKILTFEKALLMFVQLKENPAPTIVHTDMEWEDILETIDWLFGDRITPLKELCCPFSLRMQVLCYLVYLGFDCKSLANILSLSPSTIVKEKQRLKKVIGLSGTDNFDHYIRML